MATEEDKRLGIDSWARLFKATTWEEIKMLATNNSFIEEAAETAYQLSEEEKIRMQCEAREDFYRQQMYIQKERELLKRELSEKDAALEEKDAEIARLKAELAKRESK